MTTEKGLNVKTVQNGSIVIKHYLIKVEEDIAIWHALIVSGTPCCVNLTIGREIWKYTGFS